MDYASPEQSLWWTQNAEDAGKSLLNLSECADQDNQGRCDRAAYNGSMLEGVGMSGFGAWAYGAKSTGPATVRVGGQQSPLIWNYPAAGLDTLQAKVVGREEPKPMIMVTDGDWDDHRKAVWSTRLLEGLYRRPHGIYHDIWDLGRSAFKIAAGVTGTVAVKTFPYPEEDRIVCELHDTLDMWIDAFECSYSNPLTFGETTWFDPHRLMAVFPKHKQIIWDSREPLPENRGGDNGAKTRYMVKLAEGWRMKLGKTPGRYVAAVRQGTLDTKDWPHDTPPFAFLHARRSLAGFWGIPVMERGMRIAERINQILGALDKTERLLPKNILIYDIKKTPRELMKNIADVMQVGYNSEVGGDNPQYITPQIYDQTVMNLLEAHIRAFQETLGINSNQMGAQKAPGIVAAAAVRTVNDMFTELFSVISRDYTKFITTDLGAQHLRAVSDVTKSNPNYSVNWKGGNFMRKVKASVCDLTDKEFVFEVAPVAETRDTPADRIQLADEMLSRKELSPEAYQRVLATGDVPRETKAQNTQYSLVAKSIDSWMHDDLEDIRNTSPLPWMQLGDAIVQVLDGYMQALMLDVFDVQRELYFRRYITQCDSMMRRNAANAAALQGASRGGAQAPGLVETGAAPAAAPTSITSAA